MLQEALRDLLAVVDGHVVHEGGVGAGHGQQAGVDLVAGEGLSANVGLSLVAHAGPDVGVDDVGVDHGLPRVAEQLQPPARLAGD